MARTVLLLLLPLLAAGSSAEEVEERGREARQLGEQEQKYDLELSFPVEGDEATNIEDGQRKRIDSLIRDILLLTKVECPAGAVSRFIQIYWNTFQHRFYHGPRR